MKNNTLLIFVISLAFITACESDETVSAPKPDVTDPTTVTSEEKPIAVSNIMYFNEGEFTPPSGAKYIGNIVASSTWEDTNGFNFILLTQEDEIEQYHEEIQGVTFSKFIHGYHFMYNKAGDAPQLLWSIVDRYEDCEFDLNVYFIENSLEITDLDNNGIAESVFMYKADCTSDVSPLTMKLLMHEGESKYALRGQSRIDFSTENEQIVYGGKYEIDPSFTEAPSIFLDFSKEKWEDFVEL